MDDIEPFLWKLKFFHEFLFGGLCLDDVSGDEKFCGAIEDTKEFPLKKFPALTANDFSDAEESPEYATEQVGMDKIGYENFRLEFSHDFSEAKNNAEIERRPKFEI